MLEIFKNIVSLFLHLDKHLINVVQTYGVLTYALLFIVIFLETGFVVTPFLPGDSLIFVAGTLASQNALSIIPLYLLLLAAAVIGDTVNYWVGHKLGPKVFSNKNSRILKPEYLDKTNQFYAKHGGKTIILARFVPIVRTFAPFIAGIGRMSYFRFLSYNLVGGFAWVSLFTFGGFFFGNLPVIKNNFHWTILVIIFISILPGISEYLKHKKTAKVSLSKEYETLEKIFKEEQLQN